MPKAGLFLPLLPPSPDAPRPGLRWFSQVLADVGDSQDLAQNLSTFSGHLHRLRRITEAVDTSSLVLLDEVPSDHSGLLSPRLTDSSTENGPRFYLPISDAAFVESYCACIGNLMYVCVFKKTTTLKEHTVYMSLAILMQHLNLSSHVVES
jgi:hypothetical protein